MSGALAGSDMKTKRLVAVPTPQEAAKQYFELRLEIERLEKRKDELKTVLRDALEKVPLHSKEIGGYLCTLVRFERSFFKLKEAQAGLSDAVLAKLDPFIGVSDVEQVKVTYKGGDE